MSKKIELNRRRVLGGIATIGVASAAIGAGTFAAFSDTEESTGNEITAGTLDLTDPGNAVIDVTNVVPGDTIPDSGTATITSTYDASSTVDPIDVNFSTAISEPSEPTEPSGSTNVSASAFASQLTLDTATLDVNGTTQTDLIADEGLSTAADFDAYSLADAFGDVSPGDDVSLDLAMTFNSGAGNDYQADGVVIDVTFEGSQQ